MLSVLNSLWVVFRHMFRRRVTIQYPEQKPYLPPRWRGRIILSRDPDGGEEGQALHQQHCAEDRNLMHLLIVGEVKSERAEQESRADDTPEVILKRIDVYNELTLPLVEELRRLGQSSQVSALGPPAEVAAAVLSRYEQRPAVSLA